MVNGPPTPPPTGAAEIKDLQLTNVAPTPTPTPAAPAPAAAVPSSSSSANQTSYQLIFTSIAKLADQNNFVELVRVAEKADLSNEGDRHPSRMLVIAPLVLSYLILDDLPPARYALTRLPDNLSAIPLTQALQKLFASTWQRKYTNIYTRAEALLHIAGTPDALDGKLGSVIAQMSSVFVESFRQRTFALLSKAYTTISLATAQQNLGFPAEQMLAIAQKQGWAYDASTQILTPSAATLNPTPTPSLGAKSTLGTFDVVASSVFRLEI